MITTIKIAVYTAFVCVMIGMAVYIQELRYNNQILENEYQTIRYMLELKDMMLHKVETALRSTESIAKEREERIDEMQGKLNEARVLLEIVGDEGVISDSALDVLYSLGLLRKSGNEGGVCRNIQTDNSACTVDAQKGSSGDEGKDVQRPSEMDHRGN